MTGRERCDLIMKTIDDTLAALDPTSIHHEGPRAALPIARDCDESARLAAARIVSWKRTVS